MSRSRFIVPVLLSLGAAAGPSAAFGQVGISVNITFAPPALPVYVQPPLPELGYIWTPGYWAYGPDGYYWVPGTWVLPPEPGLLWTPGWWGWNNGVYVFNEGYWGPTVGFYGGIDYGYGYGGDGYQGATGIAARSSTTAPAITLAMCTSPTFTTAPSSTTRPPM